MAVDGALALFNELLQRDMEELLTYSFVEDYDRLVLAMDRALNRSIGDDVASQGRLDDVEVTDIIMGDRGVYVNAVASGTLRFTVGR